MDGGRATVRGRRGAGGRPEGGAALLLALLVLFVLIAIAYQINVSVLTDTSVAKNEGALIAMDSAIDSQLLQCFEDLALDAESGAAGAEGALGGEAGANPFGAAAAGAPGGGGSSVDSREDEWAKVQRLDIGGVNLRVLIQDEDSKYNVLTLLSEDELEAEKALERVVRILDLCREDTRLDIDRARARAMAEAMHLHLRNRDDAPLPRPAVLSFDEEHPDVGLPLSLRELLAYEPFEEVHFRDLRDENGTVVHSIESYLTVWSSVQTREELESEDQPGVAGGAGTGAETGTRSLTGGQAGVQPEGGGGEQDGSTEGGGSGEAGQDGVSPLGGDEGGAPTVPNGEPGIAVNLNTAPAAVLKSLMDDRDVDYRFWDEVIEYRNLEDEDYDAEEAPLDEFGEPLIPRQYFESIADLTDIDGWNQIEPIHQAEIEQLTTVVSHVFSIYVTARRETGVESYDSGDRRAYEWRDSILEAERRNTDLTRTVRCIVWRRETDDGVEIVPLQRWEVIDYFPFEVQDFPEEDR